MSPNPVKRVAVLGAGSWGTAFAKVLADAGTDVTLWARRPEIARSVDRDLQQAHAEQGHRQPPGDTEHHGGAEHRQHHCSDLGRKSPAE